MPTYEYRCPECGAEFEKFQKMSDEPVADCPGCGAKSQRKLSGGAGLLFKGSGFYSTDYRGEGYRKAAEAEKGGAPASEGKGESKSGGKSESAASAKSESKPASGGSSSTAKGE
jgi:putative FmdB family regulatory protein